MLAGVELPLNSSVCSLGTLLDPGMVLDGQMAAVARGAYHQFMHLHQPFLTKRNLATVAHALVIES